jgi:palmitoyltransferase ZDHHC9/14/18
MDSSDVIEQHMIRTYCGIFYRGTSSKLWLISGSIFLGIHIMSFVYDLWYVQHQQHSGWPLVLYIYVMILSITSFTLTVFTDPGILPPQKTPISFDHTESFIVTLELPFESNPSNLVYCDTCHAYRHPDASHCSDCCVCIDRLDHHCPWLSTCIGKRNYRHFMTLLGSCTLLAFLSCINAIWHLSMMEADGFREALDMAPLSAMIFLMC